jgi:hypothetical protein
MKTTHFEGLIRGCKVPRVLTLISHFQSCIHSGIQRISHMTEFYPQRGETWLPSKPPWSISVQSLQPDNVHPSESCGNTILRMASCPATAYSSRDRQRTFIEISCFPSPRQDGQTAKSFKRAASESSDKQKPGVYPSLNLRVELHLLREEHITLVLSGHRTSPLGRTCCQISNLCLLLGENLSNKGVVSRSKIRKDGHSSRTQVSSCALGAVGLG